MTAEPERTVPARLAELVAAASDGEISAAAALAPDASFTALGLTSLGFLRLIDAVDTEFAVQLDLGSDLSELDSVAALAGQLAALGVDDPPGSRP